MALPPDSEITQDTVQLLAALELADRESPGEWMLLTTDRDKDLPAAVKWMLADSSSPMAGRPCFGRSFTIEWAKPEGGGWTTGLRQAPLTTPEGRLGRIRLRTARPRKNP